MLTTAGNTAYVSLLCQCFQSSVPMKQPSKHNGFKPHDLIDFPSSAGWLGSTGRFCSSCLGSLMQVHSSGGLTGMAWPLFSMWASCEVLSSELVGLLT